jgi:hypothetical protein
MTIDTNGSVTADSRLSTPKVRVDVSDMTLGEMAEALEASGGNTDAPGFNFRQMAAMAWVMKRRTEPDYTYEDALKLKMGDIDVVDQDPEVRGGVIGVMPPESLVPGT